MPLPPLPKESSSSDSDSELKPPPEQNEQSDEDLLDSKLSGSKDCVEDKPSPVPKPSTLDHGSVNHVVADSNCEENLPPSEQLNESESTIPQVILAAVSHTLPSESKVDDEDSDIDYPKPHAQDRKRSLVGNRRGGVNFPGCARMTASVFAGGDSVSSRVSSSSESTVDSKVPNKLITLDLNVMTIKEKDKVNLRLQSTRKADLEKEKLGRMIGSTYEWGHVKSTYFTKNYNRSLFLIRVLEGRMELQVDLSTKCVVCIKGLGVLPQAKITHIGPGQLPPAPILQTTIPASMRDYHDIFFRDVPFGALYVARRGGTSWGAYSSRLPSTKKMRILLEALVNCGYIFDCNGILHFKVSFAGPEPGSESSWTEDNSFFDKFKDYVKMFGKKGDESSDNDEDLIDTVGKIVDFVWNVTNQQLLSNGVKSQATNQERFRKYSEPLMSMFLGAYPDPCYELVELSAHLIYHRDNGTYVDEDWNVDESIDISDQYMHTGIFFACYQIRPDMVMQLQVSYALSCLLRIVF